MRADADILRPINATAAPLRERRSSTVRVGSFAHPPVNETAAQLQERTSAITRASLTQTFFLRGEEQEATEYKGVILDADDMPPPRVEFDSFDKIPRTRRRCWR